MNSWSERTAYPPAAKVEHGGRAWIALCANKSCEPGTMPLCWTPLAPAGGVTETRLGPLRTGEQTRKAAFKHPHVITPLAGEEE